MDVSTEFLEIGQINDNKSNNDENIKGKKQKKKKKKKKKRKRERKRERHIDEDPSSIGSGHSHTTIFEEYFFQKLSDDIIVSILSYLDARNSIVRSLGCVNRRFYRLLLVPSFSSSCIISSFISKQFLKDFSFTYNSNENNGSRYSNKRDGALSRATIKTSTRSSNESVDNQSHPHNIFIVQRFISWFQFYERNQWSKTGSNLISIAVILLLHGIFDCSSSLYTNNMKNNQAQAQTTHTDNKNPTIKESIQFLHSRNEKKRMLNDLFTILLKVGHFCSLHLYENTSYLTNNTRAARIQERIKDMMIDYFSFSGSGSDDHDVVSIIRLRNRNYTQAQINSAIYSMYEQDSWRLLIQSLISKPSGKNNNESCTIINNEPKATASVKGRKQENDDNVLTLLDIPFFILKQSELTCFSCAWEICIEEILNLHLFPSSESSGSNQEEDARRKELQDTLVNLFLGKKKLLNINSNIDDITSLTHKLKTILLKDTPVEDQQKVDRSSKHQHFHYDVIITKAAELTYQLVIGYLCQIEKKYHLALQIIVSISTNYNCTDKNICNIDTAATAFKKDCLLNYLVNHVIAEYLDSDSGRRKDDLIQFLLVNVWDILTPSNSTAKITITQQKILSNILRVSCCHFDFCSSDNNSSLPKILDLLLQFLRHVPFSSLQHKSESSIKIIGRTINTYVYKLFQYNHIHKFYCSDNNRHDYPLHKKKLKPIAHGHLEEQCATTSAKDECNNSQEITHLIQSMNNTIGQLLTILSSCNIENAMNNNISSNSKYSVPKSVTNTHRNTKNNNITVMIQNLCVRTIIETSGAFLSESFIRYKQHQQTIIEIVEMHMTYIPDQTAKPIDSTSFLSQQVLVAHNKDVTFYSIAKSIILSSANERGRIKHDGGDDYSHGNILEPAVLFHTLNLLQKKIKHNLIRNRALMSISQLIVFLSLRENDIRDKNMNRQKKKKKKRKHKEKQTLLLEEALMFINLIVDVPSSYVKRDQGDSSNEKRRNRGLLSLHDQPGKKHKSMAIKACIQTIISSSFTDNQYHYSFMSYQSQTRNQQKNEKLLFGQALNIFIFPKYQLQFDTLALFYESLLLISIEKKTSNEDKIALIEKLHGTAISIHDIELKSYALNCICRAYMEHLAYLEEMKKEQSTEEGIHEMIRKIRYKIGSIHQTIPMEIYRDDVISCEGW